MSRTLPCRTGCSLLIFSLALLLGLGCGESEKGPSPRLAVDEEAGIGSRTSYQEALVTDGGRLDGRVLVDGEVPQIRMFPVTRQADQTVCGLEKISPRTRLGSGGEVKDAVITLAEIQRGKPLSSLEAVTLVQKDCQFTPHLMIHPAGAPFSVRNEDPMLHQFQASDDSGRALFGLSLPRRGMQVSRSLPESGWVGLESDLHPWMSAGIWITSHPYTVASDEMGAFSLEDVPPGEHRVKAWHPVLGAAEATVRVESEMTTHVTLRLSPMH